MIKPVPTLDHVVVNTRDRLDDAAAVYQRLGFTLTPRGFHTLGSANHLAMFGTHYLELIGVMSADSPRRDVLDHPIGLNGLVFGTEDAAALHAALTEASVAAAPAKQFSRPVDLPGGARDAIFRTVHVTPAEVWPGRIYFCEHLTRDLVWRDAWMHHPNGTVGVARVLLASDDPRRLGALFGRMFGDETVREVAGGVSLVVGLTTVDVMSHAAVEARLGEAAAADDRPEYMAALTLRTLSLARTEAALHDVPLVRAPDRLTVPAAAAFGCALEFVA
jgi:hypothetical protein